MPPHEGAFAEFVTMSRENVVAIPDGISFEKAALALQAFDINSVALAETYPLRRAYLKNQTNISVFDPGGVIAHTGLGKAGGGLDIQRMTLQEITFIGTYTFAPEGFLATAQAVFQSRLGPLDRIETRPENYLTTLTSRSPS